MIDYDEKILESFRDITYCVTLYNPDADLNIIERAFQTANEAHRGVARSTGEPYIFHPLGVVKTLAELKMDDASLCAGFLHDVVEDVPGWSIERIKNEFTEEIAKLVDGLTKISQQDWTTDFMDGAVDPGFDIDKKKKYFVKNATNLRKIFIAMSQDMRIMVIKLADRLHNMRTLDGLSEDRQKRMAMETIQIFAPMAHRLGIYVIKNELEELSFRYLYPQEQENLRKLMEQATDFRKIMLEECVQQLTEILEKNNIQAQIQFRTKSLWSIRNKMIKKKCEFNDITDILAVRIIVDTVVECYHALGIVHGTWPLLGGEFTDYISNPKPNGYASLHTKVLVEGDPLEVQIRTKDMHETAELGVAAHWAYKERTTSGDFFERKMSMLRKRLFQWQQGNDTAEQYYDSLMDELFGEQIFIFTPRGDAIDLKEGSTSIDFAYRIHTDVGNHCVGAKVNGIMVPINHILKNQDIVEIITRPNANPSMDWLKFAKTNQAKTKIKQYFKKRYADKYEAMGRDFVNKILSERELDKNQILTPENLAELIDKDNIKSEKDLFINIGFGVLSPENAVNRILRKMHLKSDTGKQIKTSVTNRVVREEASLELAFDGIENMLFTRGKCCEPLPGEEVVGYITRGKGITLHSSLCTNVATIMQKNPERLKPFTWKSKDENYTTTLRIKVNGQIGVINEITTIIAGEKVLIESMNTFYDKERFLVIDIRIMVKTIEQLEVIVGKLNNIQNVTDIYRPVSRIRNK